LAESEGIALIEGALVPDSGKVMLNGLETAAVQEQISSAVAVFHIRQAMIQYNHAASLAEPHA
jgi:ABC-type transport system involved in cytochrome bd biosynthesis fused ATPase/permease subunit